MSPKDIEKLPAMPILASRHVEYRLIQIEKKFLGVTREIEKLQCELDAECGQPRT